MRKLLWELREALESFDPSEAIRTSLEEARNGLLDMTFEDSESALTDDVDERHSMLKYVLSETVTMFELRSLRVLVREVEFSIKLLSKEMIERSPENIEAMNDFIKSAATLSVDGNRVDGKKRLAAGLEKLRLSLYSNEDCPLIIQKAMETLRTGKWCIP